MVGNDSQQTRPMRCEQILDRRSRDPQREAAAGGVTDQRQRRGRRGLADNRDKISEIIFKLANIADIAS
jgi:hypothetical protein